VAGNFVNLHRHDTYSLFDGFGTAKQAATYAKSMGQPALGLTNHGNVCGLVEHYDACREVGIKPILGVEAYFQPKFNPEKRRFHLTVICKDAIGYRNLMRMLSYANQHQFYRYPIVDWPLLCQHQEGLIILSGCLMGYVPSLIRAGRMAQAKRAMQQFKEVFGDRYFAEIQPIDVGDQKVVNMGLMRLGVAPYAMTLDSHYTKPSDYPTYEAMYAIADRKPPVDYSARAMLTEKQIIRHWGEMYNDAGAGQSAAHYMQATVDIADSCNVELTFKELIPKVEWDMPSDKKLRQITTEFLDRYTRKMSGTKQMEYYDRVGREIELIISKGFEDYFLLCFDLVSTAKRKNIPTGFGRGSVCGSLVAFALGITRVDPILLGTSFERFMHAEKNVTPDIDMDFGHERRGELIDYVLRKFEGKSAPIITRGNYRARNLWNDLAKLYEVDKADGEAVKVFLEMLAAGDQAGAFAEIDIDTINQYRELRAVNKRYDGIMEHFCRLYGQVRFLGQHAAGVAIASTRIDDVLTLTRLGSGKDVKYLTSYDMDSLVKLGVVKIDVLGLSTATIVREMESRAGVRFSYRWLNDPAIYEEFRNGNTEGIFQFERGGAKKIIDQVEPERFSELVACNAMNRPGTIMNLDAYVEGKLGQGPNKKTPWYPFTGETYGTLIYQEQVMEICKAAGLSPSDADKVMKSVNAKAVNKELLVKFIDGAVQNLNLTRREAERLYRQSTLYLFNKSHAVGYTLVALCQMYFKKYHPLEYWYATLRYEKEKIKRRIYETHAIKSGIVILPPHVNGTAEYSIEEIEGDSAIRAGLSSIDGIGLVAARAIEAGRPYTDETEILAKMPKRTVNKRTYEILRSAGALEFDREKIERAIVNFNSWAFIAEGRVA
jgi:DNA polymerase-3 subunit alpha